MPDGHKSQGLLIAGNAGAEVHAVTAGRVAYADWLKGYGLLMILDHGGGWMSLIVNVSTELRPGDRVELGQPIGRALGPLQVELLRGGQQPCLGQRGITRRGRFAEDLFDVGGHCSHVGSSLVRLVG